MLIRIIISTQKSSSQLSGYLGHYLFAKLQENGQTPPRIPFHPKLLARKMGGGGIIIFYLINTKIQYLSDLTSFIIERFAKYARNHKRI